MKIMEARDVLDSWFDFSREISIGEARKLVQQF